MLYIHGLLSVVLCVQNVYVCRYTIYDRCSLVSLSPSSSNCARTMAHARIERAHARAHSQRVHIRRSVLCASVLAILHWVIGLHERAECHFSDGPFCGWCDITRQRCPPCTTSESTHTQQASENGAAAVYSTVHHSNSILLQLQISHAYSTN